MENDEKYEYLCKLLETSKGIAIINKKLIEILNDKNFYKYNLFLEIINKLILNGFLNTVLQNFEIIIDKALSDEVIEIVEVISNYPGGREILYNNIELIYSKLSGEEVVYFIEMLDKEQQQTIKQKNAYAYQLYEKELIGETALGSIIKSDLSIFIEEVIKEVSNGHSLKKLESGTYSDVIETNEYVIKIGERREKFEMPYHPNILQPLLREQITDKKGNSVLVVEVQDVVNTNVNEQQRKELIEKLKKSGIKCHDILYGNVGILKKPNRRHLYNGVGGITDHENIKTETLQEGEPVIYDTDMIEIEK